MYQCMYLDMDSFIQFILWSSFRAFLYISYAPLIITVKLTGIVFKRWDSSDPDRAPPPLPLNPGSSGPAITAKAGASENIRAAAAALSERARESAGLSAYTSNNMVPSREGSPTKSLIREHHHKRLQSMQTNGLPAIRDVSNMPDSRQPRSLDRSPEKSPSRAQTPSFDSRGSARDSYSNYQSRNYRPILGENTPPVSSTMLALRNTPEPSMDRPLPTPRSATDVIRMQTPQVDGISSQMLSLMTICTNLQQEMAQLSRRSKDNAQDLVVLKDATNARDEDIRRSLKNLVNHVTSGFEKQHLQSTNASPTKQIRGSEENTSSPRAGSKSVSLPRHPTPNSFAALTDLAMPCRETGSKPFAVDGPTNIALLEKIMRDMGTRLGQDHALNLLTEILAKIAAVGSSSALVPSRHGSTHNQQHGDYHSDQAGTLSRSLVDSEYPALSTLGGSSEAAKPFSSLRAADFVGGDMVKLLKKIKDSVTEHGGMTSEIKTLLRDLRAEVLGQGRELGRRLDQVPATRDLILPGQQPAVGREEISEIIEQQLSGLKSQMSEMIKERRRQSSSTFVSNSSIDKDEIEGAVKQALAGVLGQNQLTLKNADTGVAREEVIEAIREAWDEHKQDVGEIVAENLGLQKDEILACLKEGYEQHLQQTGGEKSDGLNKGEVLEAIRGSLKDFIPPAIATPVAEMGLAKEEMLEAFRECLGAMDLPSSVVSKRSESDMRRDDIVSAIKEALTNHDFHGLLNAQPDLDEIREVVYEAAREVMTSQPAPLSRGVSEETSGLSKAAILEALKEGLQTVHSSSIARSGDVLGNAAEQIILERMDSLQAEMEKEFRNVSSEFQSSVPSLRRDNSLLMDMMKDNFDKLRSDFENYTNKSDGPELTNQLMEVMKNGLEHLESDVKSMIDKRSEVGHDEVLDEFKVEIEALRAHIDQSFEDQKSHVVDLSGIDEVLDTLREGFAEVKAEVDRLAGQSKEKDRSIDGAEVIIAPDPPHPDSAQKDDIKKLEVLITTLRIKIEAMETSVVRPTVPVDGVRRADLDVLESSIRDVANSMAELERQPRQEAGSSTLEAIETMLSNTKAKVDDIAKNEEDRYSDLAGLHRSMDQCTNTLQDLAGKADVSASVKEDVSVLESLIRELKSGMLESVERRVSDDEKITKANIEAIEVLISNTKAKLDELNLPAAETLGTKADILSLTAIVKEAHTKAAADNAATMMAFEEYKTTNNTLASGAINSQTAVKEVKEYMETEVVAKLADATSTMDALGNLMEKVEAKVAAPDLGLELVDLLETMKVEVERSNGMIEDLRNAGEENRNITATLVDEFTQKTGEHHEHMSLKLDEIHESARERDALRDASVDDLKGTAGDLKIMVDGLGSTLTSAVDRIQDDSRIVLDKVDRSYNDHKAEHELTRTHIQRSVPIIGSMHDKLTTHQPLVLEALKDIKELVAQHQINFQEFRSEASTTTRAVPPLDSGPSSGAAAFPAIDSAQPLLKDVPEKYDDAEIQHKLDQLLEHAHSSTGSMSSANSSSGSEEPVPAPAPALPSLDLLNQLHESFLTLATDFASWTSTHRDREAAAITTREKELSDAETLLTRAQLEREAVETQLRDMREEHEALRKNVENLRYETQDLTMQKVKTVRELAGVEMALEMRRAEMHGLEDRAGQLERRVLEGLIDQSRLLLLSKGSASRTVGGPKVPAADETLGLKRVVSGAQQARIAARKSSLLGKNVDLAMRTRGSPRAGGGGGGSGSGGTPGLDAVGGRRIASLNEITGNSPRGKSGLPPMSAYVSGPMIGEKGAIGVIGGGGGVPAGLGAGLKRSHSVKTGSGSGFVPVLDRKRSMGLRDGGGGFGPRQPSIRGRGRGSPGAADGDEKENEVLHEADEDLVSAGGLTGVESSRGLAPAAGNGFAICRDSDVGSPSLPGSVVRGDEEEGHSMVGTETGTATGTRDYSDSETMGTEDEEEGEFEEEDEEDASEEFEDATESYTVESVGRSRADEDEEEEMSEGATEIIHRDEVEEEEEHEVVDQDPGFRAGGGGRGGLVVFGTAGGLKA